MRRALAFLALIAALAVAAQAGARADHETRVKRIERPGYSCGADRSRKIELT